MEGADVLFHNMRPQALAIESSTITREHALALADAARARGVRFLDAPVLGWVVPEGPAWKAGLRPGDKITTIDGHPIKAFGPPTQDSITWRVITSENTNLTVNYLRDGQEQSVKVTAFKPQTKWYERRALRKILVGPVQSAKIFDIATNSPAARVGLKQGDEIVKVNGEKIFSFAAISHVEDLQTNSVAGPVTFTVRRGAEEFECAMQAEKPLSPANTPPSFGILSYLGNTNRVLVHPGPWEQIEASAKQIFATIGAVANKRNEIGVQQLGGAVMIIRVYKNFFENEDGWRWVLWFSVVLNVNLAMLNMLPLPVLDGGHILLSLIEVVRRRAVNPKILNYIQSGFAVLLIGFMLWIAFYDIGDWARSANSERKANVPIVFAPKK